MKLLELKDVSFSYDGSKDNVLNNLNLSILEGEIMLLCGKTGCGKTTLLKLLKEEIAPVGTVVGSIIRKVESKDIAFVFQNPETQLVCSDVLSNLVFHMENLGLSQLTMRKRLAETASFFGIDTLMHKKVDELSGGQKQLVALCGSLMTYPKVLILDEPLSQLDPIACVEFIHTLRRINEEFGVTILLCEHRVNECINIADRLVLMEDGCIEKCDNTNKVLEEIWINDEESKMIFMPEITKASLALGYPVCIKPKDLKQYLKPIKYQKCNVNIEKDRWAVEIKNLLFAYENGDDYVLRRLSFKIPENKITCVFGGNGCGKSTLLKTILGINKKYLGKILWHAKNVRYIPQNVKAFFSSDSVKKEIYYTGCDEEYYKNLIEVLELGALLERHPYDLSGGEATKVALASVLLRKPDVIALDEPTKGLDNNAKKVVATLLKQSQKTVFMMTHDIEFSAMYADYCAMMFDGDIVLTENPHVFFKENRYYTTSIQKAFHQVNEDVVTFEDVKKL